MAWSRGDFKTALLPYRPYIRERWHEVAIITVAANDHAASRKPLWVPKTLSGFIR